MINTGRGCAAIVIFLLLQTVTQVGAPKSKFKVSSAVGKTIPDHSSGRFHSSSLHHAAQLGNVDEILRHIRNGEDPNGLDRVRKDMLYYFIYRPGAAI